MERQWERWSSVSVLLGIIIFCNASLLCAETVTLSWSPPATSEDGSALNDLAGYKVYIGSSPEAVSESIDVGNVTTYQVSDLTGGATYYFTVTAYDTSGNESGFSDWVSKTTAQPVVPEPQPEPQPQPEAAIAINDSIAPNDDLQVPFGDITEFNSSEETVIVRNVGDAGLALGNIAQANAPFSVRNDSCSWQSIQPSGSCAFTVRFSPTATGSFMDSIDVPSNDAAHPVVTVSLSGNGLSSATNNPPSEPELVAPSYKGKGANNGNKVGFRWKKSKDPDGDMLTYDLLVCQDPDMTIGCVTETNIAAVAQQAVYYAGIGSFSTGLLLVSVVFVLPLRAGRRKIIPLMVVTLSISGMLLLASCGSGGGGGGERSSSGITQVSDTEVVNGDDEVSQTVSDLASASTYYWQVVAKDGNGGETYSPVWSFDTQ
ncbi:MAG: choice-of-anchor D domain-containing protein [Nitrospiraceae bacterium]|nr:MAG: choice-of-anchor D domain-containing protein [Nitrospiraceae bacterium]